MEVGSYKQKLVEGGSGLRDHWRVDIKVFDGPETGTTLWFYDKAVKRLLRPRLDDGMGS